VSSAIQLQHRDNNGSFLLLMKHWPLRITFHHCSVVMHQLLGLTTFAALRH